MTLWGDFTKIEGHMLQTLESDKPVLAFCEVKSSIYRAAIYFVDGPVGIRKTYLYRALLAKVRSRGMIALATTTSGVAALILLGGRTTHSRFGIPSKHMSQL